MSRHLALAILFSLAAACGGDDDGGGGDRDGGSADGSPEVDGGGGGGDGPRDRVEGHIAVYEAVFGDGGYESSYVEASILDPRPRYARLEMEADGCRMWSYQPGECGVCQGLCDAEGECVPYPTPLSAGVLTVSGVQGGDLTIEPSEYGYFLETAPPADLFTPDADIALDAAGGPDVDAFELAAGGVDPVAIELEDGGGGETDTLRLEDGGDLTVSWEPARPGTRVRLEINSDNAGHGLPVDSMIECESDDDGSLTVPRAMVEAFPEKPYQNICAGTDCPPSSLTRYRWDRTAVGDLEVELRVEFRRLFLVVHQP
ncbi:MAG TPA: hypothetical protein VFU21_13200 [Kofleriaceae bacterium]|nr:hypothetical protein [Kofleriaceae bacterium]